MPRGRGNFGSTGPAGAAGAAGAQGIQGVAGTSAPQPVFMTADQVVGGGGATNYTALAEIGTIPMLAGEVWEVDFEILFLSLGATGGATWRFQGPAAPVGGSVVFQGNTSAITTWVTQPRVGAANIYTDSVSVYGAAAFTGLIQVRAVIRNGPNAGDLVLQFEPLGNINHTNLKESYRASRVITG